MEKSRTTDFYGELKEKQYPFFICVRQMDFPYWFQSQKYSCEPGSVIQEWLNKAKNEMSPSELTIQVESICEVLEKHQQILKNILEMEEPSEKYMAIHEAEKQKILEYSSSSNVTEIESSRAFS